MTGPPIFALLALMCFLASRIGGRRDDSGALLPLEEQDRSRWDQALLAGAWEALSRSAAGDHLTEFHLQAAIAAKHASAASWWPPTGQGSWHFTISCSTSARPRWLP